MQNCCRAHLKGLGSQFSKQKKLPCEVFITVSNYQVLVRVEVAFYNRFPMGDTHVGILGYRKSIVKGNFNLEYLLLRSNCRLDIWTLLTTLSEEHFLLGKLGPQPPKVCSKRMILHKVHYINKVA